MEREDNANVRGTEVTSEKAGKTNATIEQAIENAVDTCIEQGILSDYLQRNRSDVVSILTAEYDYYMDREVNREEAMEIGIKQGIDMGLEEGARLGIEKGMEMGRQKGIRLGEENCMLKSIRNLMETMDFTADQAMEALKVPKVERSRYARKLAT